MILPEKEAETESSGSTQIASTLSSLSEHDQAYQEAQEFARAYYADRPYLFLVEEQERLREQYALRGPRHQIVANLEVIRELLA